MKVQLRNEMLVQCSSEFFVTLQIIIDADEDKIIKVIQWLIENNKINETEEMKYKWA